MRGMWAAYTGLCLFFVVLILGSAFLSGMGFGWAGEFGFAAFRAVCHQQPERSFSLWGRQLPVCGRCLGIYLGMLAGALAYPLLRRWHMPNWAILASAAPLVAEILAEASGLWPGDNTSRLATGLLLGPAFSVLILDALECGGFLYGRDDNVYRFSNTRCKTWLKRLKNRMTT
jgi:uncharacterized membrane protein